MLPITYKNILLDIVIGLALHLPTVRPEPTPQLGYLRTGANGVIFIYRPVIEPGAIRTVFPDHWSGNQTRTNISTQAHLPNKPVTQARSKAIKKPRPPNETPLKHAQGPTRNPIC
jgi:hypothetical protein